MGRRAAAFAAALILCVSLAGAGVGPMQLVRIERKSRDDLARLRRAGVPVVFEFRGSLLAEGTAEELEPIGRLGYRSSLVANVGPDDDLRLLGPRRSREYRLRYGRLGVLLEEDGQLLVNARAAGLGEEAFSCLSEAPLPRRPLEVPSPAAQAGQAGGTADPLVQRIVDAVDPAEIDRVWNDLVANPPTGTRYSTSQGCRDAAAYCRNRYLELGYRPEYHEWDPRHAPNVVAERTGAVHPERIYIVTGHLDDLPSVGPAPGADDNASGSVAVLEAARVMACYQFRNTVRFLNVTGEEQGLLGSDAYAERSKQAGEDIRGVLNFDMIGWEGDGIPDPENLDVSYNSFSQWLGEAFANAAETYHTGLAVDAFYCPSLTASDHASFWRRGYPAIIGITDNEDYCGHPGNYPYYHTSDDTIPNCGAPDFFYATVRTAVATLADLAQPFKITFERSAYPCGGSAKVVVGDADLDTDGSVAESVDVEVWSTTEPDPEVLTLIERGSHSPIFDGEIPITTDPPQPGDGRVSVTEGDLLYARYVDAVDCDGSTDVTYDASVTIDCTAPSIRNVGEQDVTDTSATIVWDTDEPSDSAVIWGEAPPPSNRTEDPAETTSHAVELTGLQSCTVYYYDVESTDPANNTARDDNFGIHYHFETLGDFGDGLQPCHEGRVTIEDKDVSCTGTVAFHVIDLDLNRDPEAVDVAVVEVTSSTETEPELVTVTETGPDTSRFDGSIATATGDAVSDGVLQTADGDVVTVTYRDADDGTGSPAVSFDTGTVDCAGPAISNLRVESITDARATILFDTDEPGDTTVEWGFTPALGTTVSDPALVVSHAVTLNTLSACAPVYFRVRTRDRHGHESTGGLPTGPHHFAVGQIPGLYWKATFEDGAPGWTLGGEWQVGPPRGAGGSSGNPDPPRAYNGDAVLGHDLEGLGGYPGDYEPNISETARSPVLDASNWTNTRLLLYKRLNTGPGDDASIWLWSGQGRPLYRSGGSTVLDDTFSVMSFDVGPFADGRPAVQLEFRQQSDGAGQYSGWNVDDVIFKDGSLPDYGPCGGCGEAPSFAGLRSARDRDGCAASGVDLSWEPAAAWGTGAGGTYAVYRGETPDFVPDATSLIASGIADTAYTDPSPPADRTLFYLVRAENDETCSTGPANGGVTDGNDVRLAAADWTSRPVPAPITTLRVRVVGGAHVRLEWDADPNAVEYRVERSYSPHPEDFGRIGTVARTWYEDVGAAADRENYFYTVKGANECGQEGVP
ncbi:MAG: M28 family peptidase [Acidobacteria bacterium]|nr:MAG: M28 family peptidase [Acidobacteriota bacterium]